MPVTNATTTPITKSQAYLPAAPAALGIAARAFDGLKSYIGSVPAAVQYTYAGLTSDLAQSQSLYVAAAAQGHRGAQFALAQNFEKSGNLTEAFKYYRQAADLESMEAQNRVGEFYEQGKGVEKDLISACTYYQKAADLGSIEAVLKLGEFYEVLLGDLVNPIKAFENYKKAADLYHAGAQFKVAQFFEQGIGVDQKSPVEAFNYYYKAALQKHVEASFKTAECYELGNGIEFSHKKAYQFYQFAAEKKHPGAQHKIADFYLNGTYVYADPTLALKAYQKAAAFGNRASNDLLQKLQSCLDQGQILEGVNEKLAFVYFLTLANQGDPAAQFAVACCHALGKGTPLDERKAAMFCIKAAGQEHARAHVGLADMYSQGKGVKKSREKASFCYQKALSLGLADLQLEAEVKARLEVISLEIALEIQNDIMSI